MNEPLAGAGDGHRHALTSLLAERASKRMSDENLEQSAYASRPHRSADHENSFGHQCSSQSFSSALRLRSLPATPICTPKMNESRAVVCCGPQTKNPITGRPAD